jgi:hypothetical protein
MQLTPDDIVESILKQSHKLDMEKVATVATPVKEETESGKIASLLEALAFNGNADKEAEQFKSAGDSKQAKIAEMKALLDAITHVV